MIHIDDGFEMELSQGLLQKLRQDMKKDMKIKWFNKVERLVGINISKKKEGVELSQPQLTQQIITDYEKPTVTQCGTLPTCRRSDRPYIISLNNWVINVPGRRNISRHSICREPTSQVLYKPFVLILEHA